MAELSYNPIVDGLRLGSLVEVQGSSENYGQLVDWSRESDKFSVLRLNGVLEEVDRADVKAPMDLAKPGRGGDESSFDLVLGPRTPAEVIGEELSNCLFEKGFCVLKVCQKSEDVEEVIAAVRELDSLGKFSRLPEEIEGPLLGPDNMAKIMWLDPDECGDLDDRYNLLIDNDQNLSHMAACLHPYSEDVFGKCIEERTPTLVSMSMTAEEIEDYPNEIADNKDLGDYLATHRRGVVRALHFMGPDSSRITLTSKPGANLPQGQAKISLAGDANTIVLYRTDCFDYKNVVQGDALTLITTYMWAAASFNVDPEGFLGALNAGGVPYRPPPEGRGSCINILNTASRLGGRWDESDMYMAGTLAGHDIVREIPITRFPIDWYYCPDPDQLLNGPPRSVQRHLGFMEGVDIFDNKYFEMSNFESAGIGPLQRLVLEVGGQNLYMQGMTKKETNKRSRHAGVTVGLDKDDYPTMQGVNLNGINAYAIIANRFSFVFNLKGPNFVCDTACSASLVATHCAKLCMYQKYDPVEFWLALGTQICISPGPYIGESMSHMITPTGRCFTFDASADGYQRGEGTSGCFLELSPKRDDRMAIFRASAAGQDGRSASMTAPNGPSQEFIIERCMVEAMMEPPEASVWECHGTGTPLGDPIEVGAVRKTQSTHKRQEPLMVSTSKSNQGHLEGGAAMAGMLKAINQCRRTLNFPSLHMRQLNAYLEYSGFVAEMCGETTPFRHSTGHCQISSFGFGGTNAHGVFYAENMVADPSKAIMKRLKMMGPPEVHTNGGGPDDWEVAWPDEDSKPGDVWKIVFNPDDPPFAPIRWERDLLAENPYIDYPDDFYSISGNFNNWGSERMDMGDVDGSYVTTVEVPTSGSVAFRFMHDGDKDRVVCPSEGSCTSKSTPILGPGPDLSNYWVAAGDPGSELHIELFARKGVKSVTWFMK